MWTVSGVDRPCKHPSRRTQAEAELGDLLPVHPLLLLLLEHFYAVHILQQLGRRPQGLGGGAISENAVRHTSAKKKVAHSCHVQEPP